jgi:hypothetical protein
MSGAQQSAFMNQRSFGPPPPPAIGSAYEGGFFAGQISTTEDGVATHNLVVGPLSTAQATGVQWQTTLTTTEGTFSAIDGPANSAAMNTASHPAAQFCEGLTIGGFSDWYMPARNELEVCYFNLKPATTSNSTSAGTNPNAVPSRLSNYTSGTPAQTSAAAFQIGGSEAFTSAPDRPAGNYWTSTQISSNAAWVLNFNNGAQYNGYNKLNSFRVRAVRRVVV